MPARTKKRPTLQADITYDGNGKQVKSVITTNAGMTTTYFIGGHYEVVQTETGTQVNKYYFAGSQRIAMRKDGTPVNDAAGNVVSQTRYKAWGEVRYQSGPSMTEYSFTGQFDYTGSFGLMYFNARFFDPSLSRFVSADSIVPPGAQGLDRYAYVNNSPLNYVDPSGHICVEGSGDGEYATKGNCDGFSKKTPTLSQMGITLGNGWTKQDARRIRMEAAAMAETLLGACGSTCSGMSSSQALVKIFGNRTINVNNDGLGAGCEVLNCSQGTANWLSSDEDAQGLIIHEYGHIFDHTITGEWGFGRNTLNGTTIVDEFGEYVEGIPSGGGAWTRTNDGYSCDTYSCQQHPLNTEGGNSTGEDFADMYMNYVLEESDIYSNGGFASNPAGQARFEWMQSNMEIWVPLIVQR